MDAGGEDRAGSGRDVPERGSPVQDLSGDRPLRAIGIALALVAGAIHFALFSADLIPGETTTVPAFGLMGIGFVACAAVLAFGRRDLYMVVPLYAGLLVFAWAATRGQYPVEVYGITSKIAEVGLAVVGVMLMRGSARPLRRTSI